MKKTRKIFAVVLALVMCFAMALPAMAAPTGQSGKFTITINNEDGGNSKYEAYQIFKGDYAEEEIEGVTDRILSNIEWGSGVALETLKDGKTLIQAIQGMGDEFEECKTAADVAKALGTEGNKEESETAAAFAAVVAKYLTTTKKGSTYSAGKYTISELEAGYYLVQDEAGSVGDGEAYTKFILKVVDNAEATPKTDVPTSEKKVLENEKYKEDGGYGSGYNDVADYNIGDKVPFAFYSEVPDTTYYDTYTFIFHDKLSKGLTFIEDSVVVTVEGVAEPLTKGVDYTVEQNAVADGTEFTIKFTNIKDPKFGKDKKIRIDYTATLNADAEIGLPGNPNEMWLEYSNNPNVDTERGNTPVDKVIVFTYEVDTTKEDGTDKEKLQGAEFVLFKDVEGKRVYAKVDNEKLTGWTDPVEADAEGNYSVPEDATKLVSGAGGIFKVTGLDDGTYFLLETKAPDGYNLADHPFELKITATTANGQNWTSDPDSALTKLELTVDKIESSVGDVDTGAVNAEISNNKGSLLPSTGGIGTTIFYIVGICLVAGAVVILVTRRRVGRNS